MKCQAVYPCDAPGAFRFEWYDTHSTDVECVELCEWHATHALNEEATNPTPWFWLIYVQRITPYARIVQRADVCRRCGDVRTIYADGTVRMAFNHAGRVSHRCRVSGHKWPLCVVGSPGAAVPVGSI